MNLLYNKLIAVLFDDSKFYKNLLKIALPIMIQNFIASSLNMVDTMMIGKIGETQIAAVGIANQYFFFFNLIIIGMFSGCSIFISQFWGKKDCDNIRRVLGLGLLSGCIISIIFTIVALAIPNKIISLFNKDLIVIEQGVEYLRIVSMSYIFTAITFNYSFASRSIEKVLLPMIVSSIALLSNTFLNYIFIFGNFGMPSMGVKGAAIATLISRIIEMILLIGLIYYKRGILSATFKKMFDFNKIFIKTVYKTVVPVVLNEGCWGAGFVVYSIVYGRIGTQAMAAVQICNTIHNLFMVIIFSMASSSVVMIGNKIGAGEEEEAKIYAKKLLIVGCLVGFLISILLYNMSSYILSFFNVSDTVTYYCLMMIYTICAILVIRVFNILLVVGILRGGGDSKYSLCIEAFTMWIIGVPIAFLGAFVFKLPVHYVYALVTIEEIVKFIIGYMRLKSDRWIKNIVKHV
ncbi:MATE family efflux transporter [Tepidibacter aestuarii]|uniref:MATE family efflux transporter n=1 Tax=Tepidibacter aestuarii TaxID=2925782 RepID=UPI002DD61E5D|nr:MATE family efflux transporter [Tepidibacter aestuarii]CAH2214037.1 MATE family efflux transporter [Tepidibacter aestuarii]